MSGKVVSVSPCYTKVKVYNTEMEALDHKVECKFQDDVVTPALNEYKKKFSINGNNMDETLRNLIFMSRIKTVTTAQDHQILNSILVYVTDSDGRQYMQKVDLNEEL